MSEDIDLCFNDINLTAYHGISGFDNIKNMRYTKMLEETLEEYKNNKTLNNMNVDKVKSIKKSDILVGAKEFIKHKWLDTIHKYSPVSDKKVAIIDGTDRYFGQMFTVLEYEPIINWLYTLNNSHGSLQLNYKKPEATLIKLFIRGKVCDDICRASYISDDFTFLFKSLDELYNRLDNFDYWIEDDRNKKNWNAVKIYLIRNKKTIYGKCIAFELQLITPKMLIIKTQSSSHIAYERMRLAREPNVLDLYKSLDDNFDDKCNKLKLNKEMSDLMDMVLYLGKFLEIKGKFINKETKHVHEFYLQHQESTVFLDPLIDNKVVIGSYQKTPSTKYQIVNGKMICVGSVNHYLTKQRIISDSILIKIKFIGSSIMIQYSPYKDCGWGGGKIMGQTVNFFDNCNIWIRNKIFTINKDTPQVYFNSKKPYLDNDRYLHELIVKMKDGKCNYNIDGKEILRDISLDGAEILDKGYFHLGFLSWSENVESTILDVKISEL